MGNSRRPRLYFHIGDPKTGTTSIQTALYRRAWDCPTKRLEYPDHLSDAKLAKALYLAPRRKTRGPLLKIKADWLAGLDADAAVISAEHFSHVRPDMMKTMLEAHIPDHAASTRFVAYVRPHAQRLLSAFAQNTKGGVFSKDLNAFHLHSSEMGSYDYLPRFSQWRAVFDTCFVLRPMMRDLLFKGDAVSDLLNIVLDGAPFTLHDFPKVNESLSAQQLACVREVQLVLRQSDVPAGLRVGVGSNLGAALNAEPGAKGDKVVLHRSLVEKIRAHYLADAQGLDQMFFTDAGMGHPMERSFDEAMAAAVDAPFPHELAAYADAAQITALRAAAQRLADLMPEFGTAWRHSRLSAIGQQATAWPDDPALQAGVARVNACFAEVCTRIGQITA